MVDATPQVLAINTVVWRRALAVWQQCGVADPRAVASSTPNLLTVDWLHRSRLANLRGAAAVAAMGGVGCPGD
jgi:transcriptional regulator of nitric oxide reductase